MVSEESEFLLVSIQAKDEESYIILLNISLPLFCVFHIVIIIVRKIYGGHLVVNAFSFVCLALKQITGFPEFSLSCCQLKIENTASSVIGIFC